MQKALTIVTPRTNKIRRQPPILSSKEVRILRDVYARTLNEPEFKVFLLVCERTKLDPFKKQIYAVKRFDTKLNKEVMTTQIGIDGFRALSSRTGRYAGQDDVIFDDEKNPRKATVTIYGITQGIRCPYTASARWDSYYPGEKLGFMWRKAPHTLLGKCAEALAHRKFAPEDTSGLYLEEEMQQAGPVIQSIDPMEIEMPNISESIDAEIEEQDSHVSEIMQEAKKESSIDDERIQIFNQLIGKGKPFGSKVKDAKEWIVSKIGVDINKASIDQLMSLSDEIQKLGELPQPSDKPIESKF